MAAARRRDGRIRLLVLTDNAILVSGGGSERFLRYLIAHLPAERYAIDVLQLAPPPQAASKVGEFDSHLGQFAYRPIDAIYGPRGLGALRDVRARVARGEYDIVQSQHEKSDIINALLPRGPAAVRRISNRRDMGFKKNARLRALFRGLDGRFDCIVAPTSAILDTLTRDESVAAERCVTIPNGVDTLRFKPAAAEQRAAQRSELGFAADMLLIGCVASFTPVKRHVDLLAAFARTRREIPRAQLLLIGEGPLRAAVEDQARALSLDGSVHFLGPRNNVEQVLPTLDLFALASQTEGLSNGILEAQACGLAVVATAVGGNPDLVIENETGALAAPLDPIAFGAALIRLGNNPALRTACGAHARRRAETVYSPHAMAQAYDALYRGLLDAR